MDISAALAADLTTLTRALDDPGIDLKTQLQRLIVDSGMPSRHTSA